MTALLDPAEFTDPLTAHRAAHAEALAFQISNCHPDDARTILTAYLQAAETGGPPNAIFAATLADAEWWADIAPPHEVQTYVYAGLKKLAGEAIGPNARARLLIALWNGMPADDKRQFLAFAAGPAK